MGTDLKPYPRLIMQFQEYPFNGDTFIANEILSLSERFNLTIAVETGTCLGSTTLWLAGHFKRVYSTEINPEFYHYGISRLRNSMFSNWHVVTKKSEDCLAGIIDSIGKENILFFLDAHWEANCPLERELEIIAEAKIKPVIAIHDFYVPNENLGYDTYNGQPFTFEWLKKRFDAIYGEGGYNYQYNTFDKSAGARRGIIYLYPL